MDAILALLRTGDRTIYEIADHVCIIPEHVRSRYVKVLIAQGKAHICRAVIRREAASPSPRVVFAYGPPPEGVPHNYGAQFTRARGEAVGATRNFQELSLTPVLAALVDGEREVAEISNVTGIHPHNVKLRLDHLIDADRIHVSEREIRDGYPKFLYALGPAPKAMPRGTEKQYAYWRKKHAEAARNADNARRRAVYRRSAPDVAAFWIPRQTTNTEIRASTTPA